MTPSCLLYMLYEINRKYKARWSSYQQSLNVKVHAKSRNRIVFGSKGDLSQDSLTLENYFRCVPYLHN